jgi:hypothetical protein
MSSTPAMLVRITPFLDPLLHQNMITLPRQARDKDKEVERTGVFCRQRQPLAVRPRDLPDLAAVTLRMRLDHRAAVAVPRRELPRQLSVWKCVEPDDRAKHCGAACCGGGGCNGCDGGVGAPSGRGSQRHAAMRAKRPNTRVRTHDSSVGTQSMNRYLEYKRSLNLSVLQIENAIERIAPVFSLLFLPISKQV